MESAASDRMMRLWAELRVRNHAVAFDARRWLSTRSVPFDGGMVTSHKMALCTFWAKKTGREYS